MAECWKGAAQYHRRRHHGQYASDSWPKGLGVQIRGGSWPVLPVFELLRQIGEIPVEDYAGPSISESVNDSCMKVGRDLEKAG